MPPRKPQKNKLVCTCFGHKCREKTHWVSHENVWKPGCLLVSQTVFRHQLSDQAASTVLPPDDNTLDLESPAELQTHLGSTENPAPNLAARDNTALATITDSLALTRISAGPGFFRLVYDTSRWMTSPFLNTRPVFTYAILAASMFTILLSASNLSSSWLLRKQRQLIELTLRLGLNSSSAPRPLTATENAALNKLPVDIHTVIKWLKLDPIIVCLNCCSRCFATYPPDRTPRNCFHQEDIIDKEVDGDPLSIPDIPEIPEERETAKRIPQQSQAPKETPISSKFGGEPLLQPGTNVPIETPISSKFCGEPLLQPGTNVLIRKFAFQRLNDWLGRLFSRPGIENALDQSLSTSPADPSHEMITDIHDSAIWHEFKGPDGSPFTATSGNLVFGLFIDGINPYGSKQGGKHVSITPIEYQALDSMHNLLLGLLKWHCIRFWAISNKLDNEEDHPLAIIPVAEMLQVSAAAVSDTPIEHADASLKLPEEELTAEEAPFELRSGQLEITFMHEFCCAGNLRGLLDKPDFFPDTLKPSIAELKDLYKPVPFTSKYLSNKSETLSSSDAQGLIDYLNTQSAGPSWALTSDWTRMSNAEKKKKSALDSRKESHSHFEHRGVTFSTWTANCKNSIISVDCSFSSFIHFAQIKDIFTHVRIANNQDRFVDTWLKVNPLPPLTDPLPTSFIQLKEQGLKVDLRLPANEDEYFINIKDVVSHCAWLEYKSGELNSKLQYSTLALISMDRE
ncbi:hypothetical protein PtA15_18A330 [Puccinia triticina]|uniref:F-box domain-containing protein n=1 Tax=Puccinia triticina TaxID=208348 RepID=A0ABY7DAC1_9BASI|nr:uncharacterized protein PtA15_18A330 [Puccinia triticina]WAQ93272.1 hypothetical protein PtA15_18A330 [Puccinia triticina]